MIIVKYLFFFNISTLIIKFRKIFYFLFFSTLILISFHLKIISNSYSSELGKIIIHDKPKLLPVIEFYELNGRQVNLYNWRGKHIILALWASWCAPCMQELTDLDGSKKYFKSNNIHIIPLSQDKEGNKAVNETWDKLKIKDLIPYTDKAMRSGKELFIRGLPTTLFIDKNGYEIARLEGVLNWKDKKIKKQIVLLFKNL